ncbi:heterokaryon incompatibility protein 6 [Xylaria bambusicola]|uniref:heterokaryon incompatibility protein 6 n=1 Tax=Xylaria bambusicola TaxID=326684 RepID=UPI002007D520|nr:heterokaryon incompatibility protein 6 [Xylaria bambusicola]KAI0518025.1 heterokaryon incompatibility protein 6 [Xylaria bambusicola]
MSQVTNPSPQDETQVLGQLFAGLLTGQSSCPIHEECDSGCSGRIGVRRYRLMPNGERREEVDERAQLAAIAPKNGVPERTQPLVIGDNVPTFKHSPLARPGSQIRLLKVKRGFLRADPVDCELVHFDIDNAPRYGALSYCWGPPPDDIKFLCNGSVFYGRPSLERSLKRLRAGFRPGQREDYIWADAICINQQDLVEKDAQIRLMERIYSGAATVYVDLGDVEGQTVSVGGATLRFPAMGGMGVQDALTHSDDIEHPLHYLTAFQALTQPWFTRTWIIQELALAKNVKYMFSGNIFTQKHLDSMLSKESIVSHPERQRELMSSNAVMRGYMNYQKLQRIKGQTGKMDSLELIQLTRDFGVTNAEDKIFGLFALLSDTDREAIGPYTRATEQVYRRFAALQVRRGRTIHMFDSAGLQRRHGEVRNLPSWVPDWTAQGKSPKVISTLRPTPYSASGTAQPHIQFIGDITGSGGISVRCLAVDTIEAVVHVHTAPLLPSGQPDFLVFHDKFRAAFDELISQRKPVYRNSEEAFARVLLMDDMYTGRNAIMHSSPITDPAVTYHSALAAWRERRSEGGLGGKKMDAVQTFQMQARTAAVGRGFATTRAGYIGLVPPCAQVGDLIIVILGATVPYVVREAQGGYVLVGDAFVHGLMYGEALQQKIQPVEIVIV